MYGIGEKQQRCKKPSEKVSQGLVCIILIISNNFSPCPPPFRATEYTTTSEREGNLAGGW